ncbi:hypothetical protein WA158_003558 [Blastocystis sp. Blastoise]
MNGIKALMENTRNSLIPITRSLLFWKKIEVKDKVFFKFDSVEDMKPFNVYSDKMYGGKSTCSFKIIEDENGERFGRFEGHLLLSDYIPGTVLNKQTFCALRTIPFKPSLNWNYYQGLEMKVRTSKAGFVFNIKPDSMFPSDLFQGYIYVPHENWATIQLPFKNLLLTQNGYASVPKEFRNRKVSGFNISITTTEPKDFTFDIAYIKGINHFNTKGKAPKPNRSAADIIRMKQEKYEIDPE